MKNLFFNGCVPDFGFRLLQELPYLSIWYDEQNAWVYAEWRGVQTHDTVVAGIAAMLYWIRQQKSTKLLSDEINITQVELTLAQWQQITIDGLAQLHENGIHYVALVESPLAALYRSAQFAIKSNHYPITLTFESQEIAISWLQHV